MPLFRTITLMLVALTMAPVVTTGVILIRSNIEALKTLTWEAQQLRVEQLAAQVRFFFDRIRQNVALLDGTLNLASLGTRERQEMLSFLLQHQPEVNIVSLIDAGGAPLPGLVAFDSTRILPSELARHQEAVRALGESEEEVRFSAPYRIQRAGRPELVIPPRDDTSVVMSLRLEAGDAAGLAMEISLAPLKDELRRGLGGPEERVILTDLDGAPILSGSGGPQEGPGDNLGAALRLVSISPQGRPVAPRVTGAMPVRLPDGSEFLLAYSPLQQPPWLALSLQPLDAAYRATRRMTWQVVIVVLVSLALSIGLGTLFAFGVTRPISRCVSGALAVARGNFGFTIDVKARNEIGELAHTFNYMSRQLQFFDGENKELLASLERGYLETIRALANSIDAKDPYTRGHSDRVTELALEVGREMQLAERELRILRYGGILHDIGKIGISEQILGKQEELTEAEREVIRQHPVLGERIIAPIDFLQPVRPLVRNHHERVDGTGYPDGLRGDAIPLGARIINAADTFDAVTSERPYQTAVSPAAAIGILRKLRGSQIDPLVCDAMIAVVERRLRDGTVGASPAGARHPDSGSAA